MIIVDRNTDYYDYVSNLYGKDPKIVFDRRDSTILNSNTDLYTTPQLNYWKRSLYTDRPENFYTLLEVGLTQYLIEGTNITRKNDVVTHCDLTLIKEYHEQTNYFNHPLSVQQVNIRYAFGIDERQQIETGGFMILRTNQSNFIPLPILKHTDITKLIEPTTIWNELQNYISSLNNDRDTTLPMKDSERAELHGFDRKTSFRHPTK